jgi:hypothetical protein
MRKLVLGVVLLAGCENKVNVTNQNPSGTVGGVVLDLDGETPLAGATVTLGYAGGSATGTTDMNGAFSISKVPVSLLNVAISAQSYESAYFTSSWNGTIGNFPVSNPLLNLGTVLLFKNAGSFAVRLIDDHGSPISGVTITCRVQVRYFSYGYSAGVYDTLQPFGTYAIKATSDATGIATLNGLPTDYALNLIPISYYQTGEVYVDVPPMKVSGTQQYQFAGGTFPMNPTKLGRVDSAGNQYPVPIAEITLAGPATDLSIIDSTIEFLAGKSAGGSYAFSAGVGSVLAIDKPIMVTFNAAIDDKTLRATVLDENGQPAAVSLASTVDTNIVTLTPSTNFMPGKRYNLALHVDALVNPGQTSGGNSGEINISAPFFTASSSPAVTIVSAVNNAGTATITFSEPVGVGYGSTATLGCVAWYENIDLDGDGVGTASYQGEYASPTPACPSSVPPTSVDVTRVAPEEPNPGNTLVTGFSTKWQVQLSSGTSGACKTGVVPPNCTQPGSGNIMHVLFSHAPAAYTVKRANGQPVPDLSIMITP